MNPSHIFLKVTEIDQDSVFTANIGKENEIENVVCNKDTEYAIPVSNINSIL